MADSFNFKQFSVSHKATALKVGTDAVLLGAAMTIRPGSRTALDIGTGCGVIALMAAQRSENLNITAIDIDPISCDEAAANFHHSPWSDRLFARTAALQQFSSPEPFDLIFSNPPFFDDSLLNPEERLSRSRHTQTLSYRDICSFAAENLSPEGTLSMILPSDCEKSLVRTAASFSLFPFRILRIRTTAKKPFKRIIAEFSRTREVPSQQEITLQSGSDRSAEYAELTKDFYL